MFVSRGTRASIAILWIIIVLVLMIAFAYSIKPFKNKSMTEISILEQSLSAKNWDAAKESQQKLVHLWQKNKLLIQINNLTPAVARFEQRLNELAVLIEYQKDSALDYVGQLENAIKSLTSLFPTPEG